MDLKVFLTNGKIKKKNEKIGINICTDDLFMLLDKSESIKKEYRFKDFEESIREDYRKAGFFYKKSDVDFYRLENTSRVDIYQMETDLEDTIEFLNNNRFDDNMPINIVIDEESYDDIGYVRDILKPFNVSVRYYSENEKERLLGNFSKKNLKLKEKLTGMKVS